MAAAAVIVNAIAILLLGTFSVYADDPTWGRFFDDTYDYVVVGGGASGSVFARRAAENGDTVLILEQGGTASSGPIDLSDLSDTRVPKNSPLQNTHRVFSAASEPQTGFFGTRVQMQYGRVLGGGTTVNAMINVRGDFADYADYPANWQAGVMETSFKYVEDASNVVGAVPPNRGFHGPYQLSNNALFSDGLPEAVIAAAVAQGLPERIDINNDSSPYGAGLIQAQLKDGERFDAYQAFVESANWFVSRRISTVTEATVEKIVFRGDLEFVEAEPYKARGVRFGKPDRNGKVRRYRVFARKGVVLAAGAIETPILLEKSGIGSANRLAAYGIAPLLINEEVGENLRDHLGYTMIFITTPSPYTNFTFLGQQAVVYLTTKTGIFATPGVNALVFTKELNSTVVNGAIEVVQGATFDQLTPQGPVTLMIVQTYNLDPQSVGSVHFSGTVDAPYVIDPNYGAEDVDLEVMAQVARRCRQIMLGSGRAFGQLKFLTGAVIADPTYLESVAELRGTLAANTVLGIPYSGTHFVGSASLDKVVDPVSMKVFGFDDQNVRHEINGLYVVDASIIPISVKANTALPVIGTAERASRLILQ